LACAVGHDVQIWNLDSKKCVATCQSDDRLIHHLEKIDDNRFASGSKYGQIQIWSSRTFECLKSFWSERRLFRIRKLPNNQLGCYQEQNYLNTTCYFNIKIWNIDSGELVLTLSDDFSWIFNDSTILSNQNLVQPDKRHIKVWEISKDGCKLLIVAHTKKIVAHTNNIDELVALNSEHVTSRSSGEPIKIWNNINWQCIKTLPGMVDWFKSLQLLTCISVSLKPLISENDYDENDVTSRSLFNVWDTTNKGSVIKKIDTRDRLIGECSLKQINAFVTYSKLCTSEHKVNVWDLKGLNCIETIEIPRVEYYLYDSIFI
jgi:WD40 repeat protein